MRHIHERLPAEEQKLVNRLLNRVLLVYAVLIVATLGLLTLKMPDSSFAEARAANAVAVQPAR